MIETRILDSIIHGRVDPYIYAFETNTIPNFLKVGDTYRPVEVRLDEWRKVYSGLKKKYEHIAKVDEETYFRDYAVHDFLMRNGFRRIKESDISKKVYFSKEFFKDAKKKDVEEAIKDIQRVFENKESGYDFYDVESHLPVAEREFPRDADWKPRDNQKEVIGNFDRAVKAGRKNLLMFAVMRFGKSFTSLCCAKRMNAKLVVVVCGKTAVRSEWKENVQRPKILDGFCFVDSTLMNADKKVVSKNLAQGKSVVVFLTMQDLLGVDIKARHKDLFSLNDKGELDLLIVDETHFGARAEEFGKVLGSKKSETGAGVVRSVSKQEKTKGYDESFDELENEIKVFLPKVKLHLSGTPYRILLDNEFEQDDIVGAVQYSDIIGEKEKWDRDNIEKDEWENPYYGFPQMIRFAFNLNSSAIAKLAELKNNGYAWDLNEFLSPKSTSKGDEGHNQFKYEKEVLDLLKAIDGSKNDANIFSFLNYDKIEKGKMCRHIVMVLPYCASCDAMEKLLANHKFNKLSDYEIINIAGFDSDNKYNKPDYALHVKEKLEKFEAEGKKTISLTVGKMLTGCTVKEWDTMIFLRNTASPQDYDQAVFRLQSQYVKTIANDKDGGKIIKYDMKPQTLLVDFDPVRMYTLQHKKSLIANINKSERGNENLEDKLKRELEIAPIVCMNRNRLQKVEAKDIVDSIRKYNASKSVMDETFDIEVDERIFDDEEIKSIILKQPEITSKGIKFEISPYSSDDENASDLDAPSVDKKPPEQAQDEKKSSVQDEEDESKALAARLQGYYFKLLLFAFLSEKEEKTILGIINHIKGDADGKRLGKNLRINISELRLVHDKINPAILSYLENKIQNINQLGKEITPDTIGVALRKMSRLSVSEVVTPDNVAKKLVGNLPPEITAKSKILDIASKTSEFAAAVLNKYGKRAKNNIYSIATSSVTCECTRKIYRLLGLPVEHIYSNFTSYDLIDKSKNERLLKELKDMKFDAIIGNPPYQEENAENGRKQPVYNLFMDCAFKLSDIISLITPARFLFNAGETPKEWNSKLLNDEHFSVVKYWSKSSDVFPTVEIKGGVAVTLINKNMVFDKIGTFIPYPELLSIAKKVKVLITGKPCVDSIVSSRGSYRLSDEFFQDYPFATERLGKGTGNMIASNFFENMPEVYSADKTKNNDCFGILSRVNGKRTICYIKKKYLLPNEYMNSFNLAFPKSNGSGMFGEILTAAEIIKPNEGATDTFINIGCFRTLSEAQAMKKYLKTKFARALLGTLKVTQDNPRATWANIPLQDFTANSDIDWSKSIPEIDKQLYAKYGLSAEEVKFIEENVKAME